MIYMIFKHFDKCLQDLCTSIVQTCQLHMESDLSDLSYPIYSTFVSWISQLSYLRPIFPIENKCLQKFQHSTCWVEKHLVTIYIIDKGHKS